MLQTPIQYFMDIDTTYRDRTTSPLPSDIIVSVNNVQKGLITTRLTNSNYQITGSDLLSEQVPIYSIFSGAQDNSGNGLSFFYRVDICGNTSQDTDVFPVPDVSGAFQEISGNYYITVDGTTSLVTRADSVGTAVNVVPMTGTTVTGTGSGSSKRHLIRKSKPTFSFGTAIGTVNGPIGSANIDASGNSYIAFTGLPPKSVVDNQFLHVYDPSSNVTTSTVQNQSYIYRINYLDANLNRLLIFNAPNFKDAKWGGSFFEILSITKENNPGMIYQLNRSINSPLYALNLLSITLPNLNAKNSGKGNSLAYYPYFYVVLCNADSKTASGNTIMSNNINSAGATFKIPMVEDTTEPSTKPFVFLKESRFINHLKIRLDRDLRFRVLFPNGNPIEFTEYDTHPPHIPNPNVQISANFSFKLIE